MPPIFPLVLASCVSSPPSYLSVDYKAVSIPGKGYVVRLGYFTRPQMSDAEWEFARVAHARMRSCNGFTTPIHREVRWFEPTPRSGKACASVVYTVRCLPHDDTSQPSELPSLEDFRQVREELLNEVPEEIEPGCGEKDGNKRLQARQA